VPPGPLEIAASDDLESDAKDANEKSSQAGASAAPGTGAGGAGTRTNSRNRNTAPIVSAIGCLPFSR
jgi:hypothetical protein